MQQLIESCLPDGFGCDKCGESITIFLINGWILLLPLLRSLFSTIAPTLMCTRKSEPHFSHSKAELVFLEISLIQTGIINFVADINTHTLNVGCSQVICGRISLQGLLNAMVEVEVFCFVNQCSDILDEFDAQERFEQLDEVGVCDWSYSVLCSQCKWRWTDIIVSSPECKLISHTIVVSLFFHFFCTKKCARIRNSEPVFWPARKVRSTHQKSKLFYVDESL